MDEEKYLRLLAKDYPTIRSATSEIINLNAISALPKGTEYFFSDLHGENEAFCHLLRSASGVIRSKIAELFENSMSEDEQNNLASLVYYPREIVKDSGSDIVLNDEYKKVTIYRLIQLCREVSSKYTRSKIRKKLPPDYAYAIDELISVNGREVDKKNYYSEIIHSVIKTGAANDFIIALCELVQRLSVDRLHVIGDIFDRGPRADIIMNELENFGEVDIQWGNHDIEWIGAACGNKACMANVVRIAIGYNNFDLLEDGYGINLRTLSMFAAETYTSDPCEKFRPKVLDENKYDSISTDLAAKMHKAITIIQFKLEGAIIHRHPNYEMDDRLLLENIDFERKTVKIGDKEYSLSDTNFPTVDPKDPLKLTKGEEDLMNSIASSFKHSKILHRHIKFLFSHGAVYTCFNKNLLFHGCIPMTEDGRFDTVYFGGKPYSGKSLMDEINIRVKKAYFLLDSDKEKEAYVDSLWYLWCGKKSPMFGKSKMATFETYFTNEKELAKEEYNPYYTYASRQEYAEMVLEEFGMDKEKSHIVNGHVPVKFKEGESPIKAGGKLFVIDGGIAKAYRLKTGIAGYTLIFNSQRLSLAEHHASYDSQVDYSSLKEAPLVKTVEIMPNRVLVLDTDVGKKIKEKMEDLEKLVNAYRDGRIKEQSQ